MSKVSFRPGDVVGMKAEHSYYGWFGPMVVRSVNRYVHVAHPKYGEGAFLVEVLEFQNTPW